jgi:hypothetical protein
MIPRLKILEIRPYTASGAKPQQKPAPKPVYDIAPKPKPVYDLVSLHGAVFIARQAREPWAWETMGVCRAVSSHSGRNLADLDKVAAFEFETMKRRMDSENLRMVRYHSGVDPFARTQWRCDYCIYEPLPEPTARNRESNKFKN